MVDNPGSCPSAYLHSTVALNVRAGDAPCTTTSLRSLLARVIRLILGFELALMSQRSFRSHVLRIFTICL